MANYQPTLDLSWKYSKSTGMLTVVAKISVTLGPNETISVSNTPIVNHSCTITLDILSGLNNSPVTVEVNYMTIRTGLNTVSEVQAEIAKIQQVTVTANVMKNSILQGSDSQISTSNSKVIID